MKIISIFYRISVFVWLSWKYVTRGHLLLPVPHILVPIMAAAQFNAVVLPHFVGPHAITIGQAFLCFIISSACTDITIPPITNKVEMKFSARRPFMQDVSFDKAADPVTFGTCIGISTLLSRDSSKIYCWSSTAISWPFASSCKFLPSTHTLDFGCLPISYEKSVYEC